MCGVVTAKLALTATDCGNMLVVDPKSVHKLCLGMVQFSATYSMEGDIFHRGVCSFLRNTRCEDVGTGSKQPRGTGITVNKVLLTCGSEVFI